MAANSTACGTTPTSGVPVASTRGAALTDTPRPWNSIQFTLNRPVPEPWNTMKSSCVPPGSVTGVSTVSHSCQPPVGATAVVATSGPSGASRRSSIVPPAPPDATR